MSVTGRSTFSFLGRITHDWSTGAGQAKHEVLSKLEEWKKTGFRISRPVTKLFSPARVKSGSFKSKPTS
ncbi:MAG: hypothetical protein Ct9H300mP7_2900 [Verrucomicrobiota bacterium]|nr:MAG: hypothetical protein Ct9H300mP7_2900 [Verrucomicrobiota bacterium]